MNKKAERDDKNTLLSNWLEGHATHAGELRDFARRARELGDLGVASNLGVAVLAMEVVNDHVRAALDMLAGSRTQSLSG
jgi:hypothetical protein